MLKLCLTTLCVAVLLAAPVQAGSTYIGATEADTLFSQITAADMDLIRTQNVLISSRSYGQNMLAGLSLLASANPMYRVNYIRNAVDLYSDSWSDMPADIFDNYNVVHYMSEIWPLTQRLNDFDAYLRSAPYEFSSQIDVAMVEYHTCTPDVFPVYAQIMDGLRRDLPNITFIFVTAGVQPEGPHDSGNEASWAFGDLVINNYLGEAPIMDWRDLLSTHADGTSAGHYMCSEFNRSDLLHPDMPFIEERLGKAFLLMMQQEAIPEPATTGLVGAGLVAMAARRRRSA